MNYRIEPHAYLYGANLIGANLTGANLTDANLTDANLTGADLTGATLTGADLTDANLTDANLTDANLICADLTHANLTDANLTHANLTDANLTGAIGVVSVRFDRRGYQLVMWQKDGVRMFLAGCRSFTYDEAIAHWGAYDYRPSPLGQQYVAAVNFLNALPL